MKINAPAKINISLDVLRRRDDGYHDVKMIMQSISLYDTLDIELTSSGDISISSNLPYVPNDERNIAYKAAKLFCDTAGISQGIKIHIEKRIPVAAGLAGGSTDAAAVLIALNEMMGKGYSKEKLMELGAKIGADVPFCIMLGCALSEGIGEKLTKINAPNIENILLVKPPISVSTKWVYQNLDLKNANHPNVDKAVECLENSDFPVLYSVMGNILESVTIKKHTIIDQIKNEMLSLGANVSMMSGSGPTVFGFFKEKNFAEKAYEIFKKKYNETYLVKSHNV